MYDRILVPTDGSEHARRAAAHAESLASAFDATLHIVSVVDLQAAAGPFDAGGLEPEFVERLDANGRELVESTVDALDGSADVHTEIVRGRPADSILEYAADNGVGLIAMGTHGRSGIRRYVAGSVAESVVRRADVPVFTVRATDRSRLDDGYDDVLVPTDGSEHALAAAEHAVALAGASGARIHALNVVDVGVASSSPDLTPPTTLLDQLRDAGERATDAVAERADEAGLDAETEVREGFPAQTVVEYADEADIDLIAMGTAGRSGIGRHLVGSTAAKVIRRAEMPVLSTTAGDRSPDA
ncbi:Nucleotide-binding universal stress protein, UspA family [Natronoarchaeum philippinense]|uniref:Nucleotide-binding universal stress protein, UspA family n=1 Tax=Natronoarchaeum philippinense TaxID=558529 RepID=A0A285P9U7_NATPI|nr:universal stress protein [Natronoarchaeum philippinense]SNZ17973.1 Nucleotide-binding universal stress protein, UspA family [Natronoarchaeum philippinense]